MKSTVQLPRIALRHLPALDGLRGLALAGVLLFHANGALPGGYLGVDLFFVLSGYLITSLLLLEHEATGRIALSAFWARRARRLMPALLALMFAIAFYGRYVAKSTELAGLRADALATLAYVANWRAIFARRSYWELFAAPSPLEHTWSLAIEEQFYIVWPLIVRAMLRRGGRTWLFVMTAGLTIASMLAMFLTTLSADPDATTCAYLGTHTRAAGILAGAALAMVMAPSAVFSPRTRRALDVLGLLSLAGLAVAWCKLPGDAPFLYRGGFWLTEVGVLVLLACAVANEGMVARLLSARPLVLLGTISYGAYLWHWPIDVVVTTERTHLHGFALQCLRLGITFAVAMISHRWVEQPLRSHRIRGRRIALLVPSAAAVAALLVVRATYARPHEAAPPHEPSRDAEQSAPIRFRVMVVGDSTANSLGWGIRGLHKAGVAVDLRGQDGCTMVADRCGAETWPAAYAETSPDAVVIMSGGAFMHGLTLDGWWRKACYPAWDRAFEGILEKRMRDLTSRGAKVWIATVPYPLGEWETAPYHAEVDCINASIKRAQAAVPTVKILDVEEELCPNGSCVRESRGFVVRPDGVHFDIDGAADLSRWVVDTLER